MAGSYYWTDWYGDANPWSPYVGSVGPPDNVLLTAEAALAGDQLERVVADVQYAILVETDRVHHPPFGVWGDVRVDALLWADTTGVGGSGDVPFPYLGGGFPTSPLWVGHLYPTYDFYDDGTHSGWTVTYRPLTQPDVAGVRSWVGPGVSSVWLHVYPFANTFWTAAGATQSWRLDAGVHALWKNP